MKKIFKLAAIAVSMALVTSLVACSSGDDDVVDASTPKYLVTAQIAQYVDSIEYDQNVSDDEIKSLKTAHEAVMDIIGDCEDCLDAYFYQLKLQCNYVTRDEWSWTDSQGVAHKEYGDYYPTKSRRTLNSSDIDDLKDKLKDLKSKHGTEKKFHERFVYIPAVTTALSAVNTAYWEVYYIGDTTYADSVVVNENSIIKDALNERQAENMKKCTDAVAALKAALTEDDSKTCKTTIDAADKKIEAFGKLENKNVTKAEIKKVLDAVDEMHDDIQTKVVTKFWTEYNK